MTQTQSPTSETPEEFDEVAQRYRRELLAHCYRMTGSVHEAEDLVQETYLRAWRAYHDFEGRSSVRTWLYRIATNVCLTNLEGKRPPTAARPGSARPARRPATSSSRPRGPVARAGARRDGRRRHRSDPLAVVADRDTHPARLRRRPAAPARRGSARC